jgi:hypothetical protein
MTTSINWWVLLFPIFFDIFPMRDDQVETTKNMTTSSINLLGGGLGPAIALSRCDWRWDMVGLGAASNKRWGCGCFLFHPIWRCPNMAVPQNHGSSILIHGNSWSYWWGLDVGYYDLGFSQEFLVICIGKMMTPQDDVSRGLVARRPMECPLCLSSLGWRKTPQWYSTTVWSAKIAMEDGIYSGFTHQNCYFP